MYVHIHTHTYAGIFIYDIYTYVLIIHSNIYTHYLYVIFVVRKIGCRLIKRFHEWNKIQLISLIMHKINVHMVKQLLENKWSVE